MHPAQRTRDVLLRGQMAEQVELLEHHADADAGALIGDIARRQQPAVVAKAETASADAHRAGIPVLEMIDAAKQRALAGTARSQQRHDLADADGQIEPVEHGLRAVALAQILDLDRDIVAGDRHGALGALFPRQRRRRRQRRDIGHRGRRRVWVLTSPRVRSRQEERHGATAGNRRDCAPSWRGRDRAAIPETAGSG